MVKLEIKEWEEIEKELARPDSNILDIAKKHGISRETIYKRKGRKNYQKMKKLEKEDLSIPKKIWNWIIRTIQIKWKELKGGQ